MVSNMTMENHPENRYVVLRYHSDPVPFKTLQEADEFAYNCGDYANMVMPIRPAQDEIDHYDDYDHYSYE